MPDAEAEHEPPARQLVDGRRGHGRHRRRPRVRGEDAGGEPDALGVKSQCGEEGHRVPPEPFGQPHRVVPQPVGERDDLPHFVEPVPAQLVSRARVPQGEGGVGFDTQSDPAHDAFTTSITCSLKRAVFSAYSAHDSDGSMQVKTLKPISRSAMIRSMTGPWSKSGG